MRLLIYVIIFAFSKINDIQLFLASMATNNETKENAVNTDH